MNHLEKRQEKIHPIETTNIICKYLFIFRKDIEDEEMYQVPSNFESKKINNYLETKWRRLQENRRDPSVIHLLINCYGLNFVLLGLLKLITSIILLIVQPHATAKLVSYFTPQSKLTTKDAYFYAALLIGIKILNCIFIHNYHLLLAGMGIKIRTALCTLVYKKMLKVNQFHLKNIGLVVTLITKDVEVFERFVDFGNDSWIGVTQVFILTFVLYRKIGWAAFVGMAFLWISILFQIYIFVKISAYKKIMCERADERYQIIQETLSYIKIIKMYVWEKFFQEKISDAREKEANATQKILMIKFVGSIADNLSINITLYVLLATYLMLGNNITAEIAFFTVTCCDLLTGSLGGMFLRGLYVIGELITSVKRVENVFTLPETKMKQEPKNNSIILSKINFNNIALKIGNTEIFRGINITIQKGLTLITGQVSSGKTSLLKLILQEYEPESGNIEVLGSLSYASQEPWLFPSTIRQNILFGEPYHETRYQQVLQICALTYDLELFDCGDLTVIEDQGFNLSKGQQIRINLARAVYKLADIYLLDDCLAGLDVKVSDFIFKECIQKFLQEKLVILVTSNTKYMKNTKNTIVVRNGEPTSVINNPSTNMLKSTSEDKTETFSYVDNSNEDDRVTEDSLLIIKSNAKKKVYKENNKVGKVDSDIYMKRFLQLSCFFYNGGGSNHCNIQCEYIISYASGNNFCNIYCIKKLLSSNDETSEKIRSDRKKPYCWIHEFHSRRISDNQSC
ncbi:ABC membrane domain containing protein [Asbolus verrucosus]|uniref:ABC membrane domain containing protein n=1 Tax=Asbolus verrucosus TaxID=1661398 RepID=A0A482WC30_ASBVE|nr:ABC membrane domain containing protein [Asbolus verrucosus]